MIDSLRIANAPIIRSPSLAFEIEQSLSKSFGPLGITVSQLYGGSTANVTDFELINQSQVIIATPEKAKALIRCG